MPPNTRTAPRLLALSLFACALPAAAITTYEGRAYAPGSERLLYRESHFVGTHDGARERLVLYRCPDGTPFARKIVRDTPSATAPDFELEDARNAYREGVRTRDGAREVFVRQGDAAQEKTKPLPSGQVVIDAGFDRYVRDAWSRLDGSDGLTVPFLLPSRLAAYPFDVRTLAGDPAQRTLRLSLGKWFGGMLPHIDVTYDARTRELLRYQGVANIRSAGGGNLAVDLKFPRGSRRDGVPASEVEHARGAKLANRCA